MIVVYDFIIIFFLAGDGGSPLPLRAHSVARSLSEEAKIMRNIDDIEICINFYLHKAVLVCLTITAFRSPPPPPPSLSLFLSLARSLVVMFVICCDCCCGSSSFELIFWLSVSVYYICVYLPLTWIAYIFHWPFVLCANLRC